MGLSSGQIEGYRCLGSMPEGRGLIRVKRVVDRPPCPVDPCPKLPVLEPLVFKARVLFIGIPNAPSMLCSVHHHIRTKVIEVRWQEL